MPHWTIQFLPHWTVTRVEIAVLEILLSQGYCTPDVKCFNLSLNFQARRVEKMDHFFGCVAMLMSRHLRMAVGHSLEDLVEFFERYSAGNSYQGGSNAPLPILHQPIVIRLVSIIILSET